jgi:hypothetical protein
MADTTPAVDPERMRQWIANWRLVNDAQDELIRSEPIQDPAACLKRGLSLIELARRLRGPRPATDLSPDPEDESVRETWRRLHASRGR